MNNQTHTHTNTNKEGIGNFVRSLFEMKKYEKFTAERLASVIKEKFPKSKITAAHVSCYKSRLRPEYQKHLKELKAKTHTTKVKSVKTTKKAVKKTNKANKINF